MNRWILMILLAGLMMPLFCAELNMIEDTPGRLVFTYRPDTLRLVPREGFTALRTDGLTRESIPGRPDIPFLLKYVAAPPEGDIQIDFQVVRQRQIPLNAPPLPVPYHDFEDGEITLRYELDPSWKTRLTERVVEVLPRTVRDGVPCYPIRIYPYTWDGESRGLTVRQDIRVTVRVEGGEVAPSRVSANPFHRELFLNHRHCGTWRSREEREVNYARFSDFNWWYRFEAVADGMHVITYDDLAAVDFPFDIADPALIRIFTTGGSVIPTASWSNGPEFREIPREVTGASDELDPGSSIYFWAEDRDGLQKNEEVDEDITYNPYSGKGVYWLTFGESDNPPPTIPLWSLPEYDVEQSLHPVRFHYEDERLRSGENGFYWYTSLMAIQGYGTTHNFNFTIDGYDPEAADSPPLLVLRLLEEENSDNNNHRMRIEVNGVPVLTVGNSETWSWSGDTVLRLSRPCEGLVNGQNTLSLIYENDNQTGIYLDFFSVLYDQDPVFDGEPLLIHMAPENEGLRVFYRVTSTLTTTRAFLIGDQWDVTELTATAADGSLAINSPASQENSRIWLGNTDDFLPVTGLTAVTPTDLTTTTGTCETLILYPEAFEDQAQTLRSIYENDLNISTQIASMEDIFNQFNAGMPDPMAVRLFIKWLDQSQSPSPLKTVTLLGSGTTDWRNYSGVAAQKNKFIVFQKGNYSSNDYFVHLSQSSVPDLGIGRYPVQTASQLETMIERFDTHMNEFRPGWWRNRVLMVADDQYHSSSANESEHTENTELNALAIDAPVLVDRLYAVEYELDPFNHKPEVRNRMIDRINQGVMIWYFNGHGNPDKMGDENYFTSSDLPSLDNEDRLPLMIAASCSVGKFQLFNVNSLAERLLYDDHGGAMASLAACQVSFSDPNALLMGHFLDYAVNRGLAIGEALKNAKNLSSNDWNDIQYIILGDPNLRLLPPPSVETVQLNDGTDGLQALELAEYTGSFPEGVLDGTSDVLVLDSSIDKRYELTNTTLHWIDNGYTIFRGRQEVTDGQIDGKFIVPYDITGGDTGKVITYLIDNENQTHGITFREPVQFDGHDINAENPDEPVIQLWLNNENFQNGDTIHGDPVLIADIADSNGVNIMGRPGHKIIMRLDDSIEFTEVTEAFWYDDGSHTAGRLEWQLSNIPDGNHRIELFAFDNLNRPSGSELNFRSTGGSAAGELSLRNLVPYPSPWDGTGDFWFTFEITEDADVKIAIYTMTGRKIRTIHAYGLSNGYQQIMWDGRDQDGDIPASNTYFYRIEATTPGGGDKVNKTDKFVILK